MIVHKEFTALTGLFRSSSAFATATYGTVAVPPAPSLSCNYRLNLGKTQVLQSLPNVILRPELKNVTLYHAGSPPESRSVVSFLRDKLQLPITIRLLNMGVLLVRGTLTGYQNQQYSISINNPESLPDVLDSAVLEICG